MTKALKSTRILHSRITRLVAPLLIAVAVLIPATAAHASYHMTKRGAEQAAKNYVAHHYANTYEQNLIASCRPQGYSASDPRYIYHRWVCTWVDRSDNTTGQVLIAGSDVPGSYYGRVVHGATRL
jgi:hypothetical protein